MSDLKVQFAVYDPDGERRGLLPYPLAASVTDVMNDLGSGSLDYLAGVQHSQLLGKPCEVAIESATGPNTWKEHGARLLRLKRGASVIDEMQTRRYTLQSYGFMLGKIRLLRPDALNESGERPITNATAGTYVRTMIDEAKLRGNVPGLTYTFTSTHDSAGKPWAGVLPPFSIRYGDDLLSSLRSLSDQGLFDWRVIGRELKLYNVGGLGVDRSATVILRNGHDVLEAPDDEDGTEMAGRIGVQGDNGRTYAAISPSVGPWGLWEETVNASGISDLGGLQFVGEAEQRRRSAPRVQMTRQVVTTATPHLPQVNYEVGDTISAPNETGKLAPLRVREINLAVGSKGIGANLTLNDRILERDILDRRTISGLLGGASKSSGGSGIPSGSDDKRVPKVPIGFVVNSSHLYTPEGAAFAVIDAAWVPVTQGTDNIAVDVDRHEIYARRNVAAEPWRKLTEVAGTAARLTYSPLPIAEEWQFKIRATSRQGVLGAFSAPLTVMLAEDTEPPPPPSTPKLTTRLGVVAVTWDGLDNAGHLMPVDFDRVDIWHVGTGAFVGTLRLSGGEDSAVITGLAYGVPQTFRLVAIDQTGNVSEPSAGATITPQQVEGSDIRAGTIEAGHIKADAIDATRIKADAITAKHTITGALVRTAASGARTEMNNQGLRTLDAAGNELVKVGYGVPTGMQIRSPENGAMVALAPLVLGLKNWKQTWTATVGLAGAASTWSAWANPLGVNPVMKVSSPTGRFMVHTRITCPVNSQQNYQMAIQACFYLGTMTAEPLFNFVIAGSEGFASGEFSYAGADIIELQPNVEYGVRPIVKGKHFMNASIGGYTSLSQMIIVVPI